MMKYYVELIILFSRLSYSVKIDSRYFLGYLESFLHKKLSKENLDVIKLIGDKVIGSAFIVNILKSKEVQVVFPKIIWQVVDITLF